MTNNLNKARLVLIFPFISISIILMHVWIIQRVLRFGNDTLISSYSLFNSSMIISFIGHIFLSIFGFVLYGSIRDKDFMSYKFILSTFVIIFILFVILAWIYFSSLISNEVWR